MDKRTILIVAASFVAAVFAEPPSQYGPPSGAGGFDNQFSSPSSQYGAPGGGRFGGQGGHHGGGSFHNNGGFAGYDGANGFNGDEGSEPANYEFKYDVEDQEYGVKFGHEENRQGDVAMGAYYVLLPDGRTQRVQYVADQDGYKPMITYEDSQGGGYGRGGPGGAGGYSSEGPSGFGSQGGQHGGFGHSNGGYQFKK